MEKSLFLLFILLSCTKSNIEKSPSTTKLKAVTKSEIEQKKIIKLKKPIADSNKYYLGALIQKKRSIIRACFEYSNSEWSILKITNTKNIPHDKKLYESLNETMNWYVLFDGKTINKIFSNKDPQDNSKGLLIVNDDENQVPEYDGNGFNDWSGPHMYRPVVVSTKSVGSDPEKWKPARPSAKVLNKAIGHIKDYYDVFPTCNPKNKDKRPEKSDFQLIKAYKNIKGDYLLGVQFSGPYYCDIAPNEVRLSSHWYSYKNNTVHFLGTHLVPMDAGDYDQDGKSEWVFKLEDYNEDGIVLLDDDGKLHKCSWGYH